MKVVMDPVGFFNVFIDDPVTGAELECLSVRGAYAASAIANHMIDTGYRVKTDLWGAVVADAMVSPDVWEAFQLSRYPALGTSGGVGV